MSGPLHPRDPQPRFRDRAELLDFLLEVSSTASAAALNLDELLSALASLIRSVIPVDALAILLYSERRKGLIVRYSLGHPGTTTGMVIPLDEGITGIAASARVPMVIGNVLEDPNYIPSISTISSEMAIPMVAGSRLVGVIDLQSVEPDAYTTEDSALVQLIASRAASYILNARLFRRVEKQNRTFRTLASVSREFAATLDLDKLLHRVASTVHDLVDYDAFSVFMVDETAGLLRARFNLRYDQEVEFADIPLDRGITGSSARQRASIRVDDTRQDPRYVETTTSTRSELAVPLLLPDRVVGVINVESVRVGFFTEDHEQTLNLLAPLIAGAVENARLYEEVDQRKKSMEADLAAARHLQTLLLPKIDPEIPGLEIGIAFRPAREISGDVFDFFEPHHHEALIAFGDVSGKSTAAALYGAMVTGLLRSLAPRRRTPARLLDALNDALLEQQIEGKYLTLFVALWEPRLSRFRFSNAANVPPLLCRDGKVSTIHLEGFPLGLLTQAKYDETIFEAHPGDLILLYSDGIQDQLNVNKEEYSHRLPKILAKLAALPAPRLVDAILDDLDEFRAGRRLADDQTLIAIKVTPFDG